MTAQHSSNVIVLRGAAVAVFVAGVLLMALPEGLDFWGRLPGAAMALGLAPWMWAKAGRR